MTVHELEKYFDEKLSPSMSCEWDNDGLMLCADSGKEVRKALLTLDITPQAVNIASEVGVDAIFTHHPFFFNPLKALCDKSERVKLIFELIKKEISVFSYHTRLDAAVGGVNDILANLLSLKNVQSMGDGKYPLGRIGVIDPCTIEEFASLVKRVLLAPSLCVARSTTGKLKRIKRVCVLGGVCDREYAYAAIEQGADVMLTGDISYNLALDANLDGLNVICAGHYASENPALSYFKSELSKFGIDTVQFDCGYFQYI